MDNIEFQNLPFKSDGYALMEISSCQYQTVLLIKYNSLKTWFGLKSKKKKT